MSLKPNRLMMEAAIQEAERNQSPFGAAVAMGDQVFTAAAHQINRINEPSVHATISAIRKLKDQLQKKELSGFTLYITCEPCPVCMNAVLESGMRSVVYGCGLPVISKYQGRVDDIRAGEIISKSTKEIELHKDFMETECEALLQKYY